jgi:nucleotide-binding universal stress UspA family protein
MNIFPKILCAVDFSPCSRLTSHYGRELAARLGSDLVLLHVKPSIAEVYENIAPELATYISHDDAALLETFNDFSGDWAGRYEKIISSGVPHEEILRSAETIGADLIIMGAKGLSRLERFLLGGTTEKVVRRATCPVLTVHDGDPHLPVENILFATDLSAYAAETWPLAARLSRELKAKTNIAHILDLRHLHHHRRRDEAVRKAVGDLENKIKIQLRNTLDLSGAEHDITIADHTGGIAAGLIEMADAQRCDLIVMPAHGKRPLAPSFIGGITERVVRMAHCPVMTVRHKH